MARKKSRTAKLETLIQGRHLHDPGDDAVRSAVQFFRCQEARKPLESGLFRLLFDSFAEPLPAGVRSVATADRRLLVAFDRPDAEPLQVDLQIRRDSPERCQVVGQLLPPVGRAELSLREEAAEKARSTAEATGEFTLEYSGRPTVPLTLRIEEPGGAVHEIPAVVVVDGEG